MATDTKKSEGFYVEYLNNVWFLYLSLLLEGAGLRWRPLHVSAKALTEPAGETGGNMQYCRMRGLARLQY